MISKTELVDFNKKADVVACYAQFDGKFVMLQRQGHKSSPNQWGLPAGKVDEGETISQAMKREIMEETGIELAESDLHYFDSLYVRNLGTDIYYHMFSVNLNALPKVVINSAEHKDFNWFTPEESLKLDLVHDLGDCTKLFYGILK